MSDAPVVERMKSAGAILIAVSNVSGRPRIILYLLLTSRHGTRRNIKISDLTGQSWGSGFARICII